MRIGFPEFFHRFRFALYFSYIFLSCLPISSNVVPLFSFQFMVAIVVHWYGTYYFFVQRYVLRSLILVWLRVNLRIWLLTGICLFWYGLYFNIGGSMALCVSHYFVHVRFTLGPCLASVCNNWEDERRYFFYFLRSIPTSQILTRLSSPLFLHPLLGFSCLFSWSVPKIYAIIHRFYNCAI